MCFLFSMFLKCTAEKDKLMLVNLAIDDVLVLGEPCDSFGSCTFEERHTCMWQNVYDDESRSDFDWQLGSHKSDLSDETGPSFDHTLGTPHGVYLYAEASSPVMAGYRAVLESPLFQATPSHGLCMHFWYHMYGRDMGSLNLYINVLSSSSPPQASASPIWSQHGDKGDHWLNAQVSVKSSKSFRLSLEAVRGADYRSDIAIDDIDFIERECVSDKWSPTATTVAPPTTTAATSTPSASKASELSRFDCDFESGMCEWRTGKMCDQITWKRAQGRLGREHAGPIAVDHTTGRPHGWYLFAQIGQPFFADTCELTTRIPLVTNAAKHTDATCMHFYYYFFSDAMFKFDIFVSEYANETGDDNAEIEKPMGHESPAWSRSKSQGNYWKLARVTLNSSRFDEWRVVMRLGGVVAPGLNDLIGLDDITFGDGACRDSPGLNQLCTFSGNYLCDYKLDQKTSGDEDNNTFQWKLHTPESYKSGPLPIMDHTSDDYGSGYVYAAAPSNPPTDGPALLRATMISVKYEAISGPLSGARCLEFYFYLNGETDETLSPMKLNVRLDQPNDNVVVWSRDYAHGESWWKADVSLRYQHSYALVYEALVNASTAAASKAIAALDDIILKDGQCSRYTLLIHSKRKDVSFRLFFKR